jgi:membrane protein required for colicin V production
MAQNPLTKAILETSVKYVNFGGNERKGGQDGRRPQSPCLSLFRPVKIDARTPLHKGRSTAMIFDCVVLAALLVSCLIAFFRGLIREVLTILGVIGGGAAAAGFGPKLQPVVLHWLVKKQASGAASGTASASDHAEHGDRILGVMPPDVAADIVAYGGTFIAVVIVLSIFSHLVSGAARKVGLGPADRALGVLFGIARAIILLALPYYAAASIEGKANVEHWTADSRTAPVIEATADWLGHYVPKSVSKDLNAKADKDSSDFTNGTREKLEQLDLLGQALKEKGEQADQTAQAKGAATGDTLRQQGKIAGDELKKDAGDIHQRMLDERQHLDQQLDTKDKSAAPNNGAGYGTQQRGQMDGLIQQENTGVQNGPQ